MIPRYLLDTNTVSERVRRAPHPGLVRRFDEHDGEMAIASPVWHELRFGCALLVPSKKRRGFEQYLDHVVRATMPILPYDAAAAEWHAQERARLTRIGKTPAFIDGQIASIARLNDLVVVTTNTRDFVAFEGLKVEDWRTEE